MTDNKADTHAKDELPTEVIVPSDWAEAQMAKGILRLTPKQIERLEGRLTIKLPADVVNQLNPPRIRKSPIEWIEPIEAVHWLSNRIGGDAAAKSAIAERLRDGAIECSIVWMSQGPDVGAVSNQRPRFPVIGSEANLTTWVTPIHRGCEPLMFVGRTLSSRSDDWDADQRRWDWQAGLFVCSYQLKMTVLVDGAPTKELKSKLGYRLVVSGIRFNSEDVKRIVEGETPNLIETPGSVAKRGRKEPRRKKFNYGPVLARLQSEISNGEISRLGKVSDFGVQAKLEREITEELTEEDGFEPSETTVRRKAKELMDMWKQLLFDDPR